MLHREQRYKKRFGRRKAILASRVVSAILRFLFLPPSCLLLRLDADSGLIGNHDFPVGKTQTREGVVFDKKRAV